MVIGRNILVLAHAVAVVTAHLVQHWRDGRSIHLRHVGQVATGVAVAIPIFVIEVVMVVRPTQRDFLLRLVVVICPLIIVTIGPVINLRKHRTGSVEDVDLVVVNRELQRIRQRLYVALGSVSVLGHRHRRREVGLQRRPGARKPRKIRRHVRKRQRRTLVHNLRQLVPLAVADLHVTIALFHHAQELLPAAITLPDIKKLNARTVLDLGVNEFAHVVIIVVCTRGRPKCDEIHTVTE